MMNKKKYTDLGFAKIDNDRINRNGYSEVIYGEGKEPDNAGKIFKHIADNNDIAIATRVDDTMAKSIIKLTPKAKYYKLARLVIYSAKPVVKNGYVVVATAGTADISVAEEASLILETYGSYVERLYDVGVAGIDRLLSNRDILDKANCIVAVAGMEGALPSVIAGLVSVPVIAVPTSVGYGASFGGIAALLAMLNSCAKGVTVVNIGNGFGAAVQADMINKLATNSKIK